MLISTVYAAKCGGLAFKVFDQFDVNRKIKVGLYIDGQLVERRTVWNRGDRFSVMIVAIPSQILISQNSFLYLRDEENGEVINESLRKFSEVIDIRESQTPSKNKDSAHYANTQRSIIELLRGSNEA
jgi:hypothetical protein